MAVAFYFFATLAKLGIVFLDDRGVHVELTTPIAHKLIDLTGLRCPHIVISTFHALRMLKQGQILQLTTTDLNSPSNIAAWCRQSGHPLLDMYEENGRFVFYIQYCPQPAPCQSQQSQLEKESRKSL